MCPRVIFCFESGIETPCVGLLMFQAGRCKHIPEKHFKGETFTFHAFFMVMLMTITVMLVVVMNAMMLMTMMLVVMMNMGTP